MTKKRPHIYTRVSKAKQIEGSGLDEQTARIQQYLKDKQHLFEGEPVYWTDVGLSAYRNKNITDGQLGKFMKLVDSGAIGEGDALIIYSLDRLSRRSAWDEVTIPKIVNSRCDIHDVSTPVVLKHDDPFSKIIMELIIQRGNNESKIKSERSTSGWEMRFDNMVKKGDVMTRRLPRWLDYDESCGYTLKEREVSIIRDIFKDYASGISSPVIAKRLNSEGILINDSLWRPNAITKLIKDERLLGFFRGIRNNVNIPNIFPKIIDEETFVLANRILKIAGAGKKGRPRYNEKDRTVRNILTGFIRCGKCGGPVTTSVNGKGDRYIRCRNRINFVNCNAEGFRYDLAEKIVFSHVKNVDFSKIINGDSRSDELEVLKVELVELQLEEAKWIKAIEDRRKNKQRDSLVFADGLTNAQDRIEEIRVEISNISIKEPVPVFDDWDIATIMNPENVNLRLSARKMLLQILDTVSFTRDDTQISFKLKYHSDIVEHIVIANIKTMRIISHGSVGMEGSEFIFRSNFMDVNFDTGKATYHTITDPEELSLVAEAAETWNIYMESAFEQARKRSEEPK